jgi:MoaA/NifB/PqqE/SkfB family radical SAM enzyme
MKKRFFFRVAKRYLDHKFFRTQPVSAMFRITTRCNLLCSFCLIKNFRISEMTTKKKLGLIDELDRMGLAYLTVSGGEPLMVKDFEQIAQKIGRSGIVTSLNTNGTLVNRQNALILARNFDIIRISVDGDKETHEKIRGSKGSHAKALKAIEYLMSVNNRKAKVCAHMVLTNEHYEKQTGYVSDISRFCDSVSVMPEIDPRSNKNNLSSIKTKNIGQTLYPDNPSLDAGKRFCDAGKLYFQILPNGNITPCANIVNKWVMGNVCDSKISEILKNEIDLRSCPGCYSRCTTEISMIFNQNAFKLMRRLGNTLKKTVL